MTALSRKREKMIIINAQAYVARYSLLPLQNMLQGGLVLSWSHQK
jgi:hypothetical protein